MQHLLQEAQNLQENLINDRRWLHSHAEVGFSLEETLEYVQKRLKEMGYTPEKCGKSGIITKISGEIGEKCILLRADMDALPIQEESGLPYSCGSGNMHACGHDMHTAMLLGAAALLKAHEKELNGTVKLMFQPAEEILEGANDMVLSGVLENPKPDAGMMIHVLTALPIPAGTVIVSPAGVSAPAADYFTIRIQGKGCHGSAPEDGIDAITVAAHIITALQEIHARELPAAQEAVLTIGKIQAGNAANAIADTATLQGTLRAYDEETRFLLKNRLCDISRAIAEAFRCTASVVFDSSCPTLLNDKNLSCQVYQYAKNLLNEKNVLRGEDLYKGSGNKHSSGSEDFAYVSHKIPTIMLALAAGEPEKGYNYPLHHPMVKFDESVLPIGAAVFAASAIGYLSE